MYTLRQIKHVSCPKDVGIQHICHIDIFPNDMCLESTEHVFNTSTQECIGLVGLVHILAITCILILEIKLTESYLGIFVIFQWYFGSKS